MEALQEKISEKMSNRKNEKEKLSKRKKEKMTKRKKKSWSKENNGLARQIYKKLWNWPTSQLQSKSGDKNHKKF